MRKISNQPKERATTTYSQIYWHDFFSKEDVDKIVQQCGGNDLERATVSKEGIVNNALRISSVKFHNRTDENSWIFDRLNFGIEDMNDKFYNFDLNGYSFFQYSEYYGEEGGKYDFHMDMYTNQSVGNETRKLSLTLLLSEPGVDFEGGEFEIKLGTKENQILEMRKGSLIAFPSFIIHRVTPVTKGVRRSIVVWVEGPKFK